MVDEIASFDLALVAMRESFNQLFLLVVDNPSTIKDGV